jgi:hypothetical protein
MMTEQEYEVFRTAGLRNVDALYVRVAPINSSVAGADELQGHLEDIVTATLEAAGVKTLTIEECSEMSSTPHLVLDCWIIPVTNGYFLAPSIELWQQCAPWSNPTSLIHACTWRMRAVDCVFTPDELRTACERRAKTWLLELLKDRDIAVSLTPRET